MRVSVFGLGYVGCVTAACLAKAGHRVAGVDTNPEKVALVKAGTSPLVEPGLGELLREVVGARSTVGHRRQRRRPSAGSDLALICVGTPSRDNGQLDVSAIQRVAEGIGQALRRTAKPFTVVLRSTVLPGTTETVLVPALAGADQRRLPRDLEVAVNPEFMREGSSLRDFGQPPLTLVGSESAERLHGCGSSMPPSRLPSSTRQSGPRRWRSTSPMPSTP